MRKGNLLEVQGLTKHFTVGGSVLPGRAQRRIQAVDGVSFTVGEGETLGLVGESGCGKSTLGRLILRLLDSTSGTLRFDGLDITHLKGEALQPVRRRMQMVFQDPFSSLNPRLRIGTAIREPLDIFRVGTGGERRVRVNELLERVGLDAGYGGRFPHELSGGQRQRVGIAVALALEPSLIVADEPVSALDVSVQAQILNLLHRLQRDLGLTLVFIAHNLDVVEHISDRVAVMYLGKMVEIVPTQRLFQTPEHPYTKALLSAIPIPDPTQRLRPRPLPGEPPSPIEPPHGCRFHPRCGEALPICKEVEPALLSFAPGCAVACHVAARRLGLVGAGVPGPP
jgi:oligopeptide/dipeptide ABC transporter ATP-binding protein